MQNNKNLLLAAVGLALFLAGILVGSKFGAKSGVKTEVASTQSVGLVRL
jgi:hypothetical protein